MNFSLTARTLLVVGAVFGLSAGLPDGRLLRGQAPLLDDAVTTPDSEALIVREWKVNAAEQALQAGLAVLAEDLFREVLGASELSDAREANVRVRLASALIAQRDFDVATSVLEAAPESRRGSVYYLYRAAAVYGDGWDVDVEELGKSLSLVDPDELTPKDRPWWHLLQGLHQELMSDDEDDDEAVQAAFARARESAVTSAQRRFFDSLVLRERMRRSPASEALALDIRERWDRQEGSSAAYSYAREYAIILNNLGRKEEAIAAIDRLLANTQADYGKREPEQLLLLKGMILGVDSGSGRTTLRELIRNGSNREVMGVALQLLARGSSTSENTELWEFLNERIAEEEQHPLLGQFHYLRSQLALARGDTEIAEEDARRLLEQFPGLGQIRNVYRLLAYAALQRDPPQYRSAADFLIQYREAVGDSMDRMELNRLIGDCYFLNGDYASAVGFYESARHQGVLAIEAKRRGDLFLRLVTAQVRAGEMDAALQLIDDADFGGNIDPQDRWQAEWNVAQALQGNGQPQRALDRVRDLLEGDVGGTVPAKLDLRLRWLEARLLVLTGQPETVDEKIDSLLERINEMPEEALDPEDARLLRTELLLLRGELLIRDGEPDEALEAFELLRSDYEESAAAQRSYLAEAELEAAENRLADAQETLTELAEKYPDSKLAPQALFEAGLYCEQRGPDAFEEAVRLHNRLAERYPDHPLVFDAGLKQGDLLRRMNNFASAQTIYENLINRFTDHSRLYVAELSRADCLLALAKEDEAELKDVAAQLERLMDMPDLPVDFQAEAGYKWGFALKERGALEEAQSVFTLLLGRFLLEDADPSQLGGPGRYWVSRVVFDLGSILEGKGEPAEARRLYENLILYNLPGKNLARKRMDALQVVEEG
ncbi:MAG: tetratricopeptide repeat protein [Opitutales bacterium]